MTALPTCPTCGCDLPADFPPGLCPDCLFAAGLESADSPPLASSSQSAGPVAPLAGGFVPPPPDSLARHFPQLEIVGVLGQGGMGAVYQARQTKLDRLVALKIIRPESADDPAFAERFNREARMLARLNHPNIVAVYDFGEITLSTPDAHGETPRTLYYFVMEYVDGANLRQLIGGGTLRPEQSLAIVPQVCDALQYAHDEGIVHRDIKPENILIDRRGRAKIADFGLAKLAARSEHDFTLTGTHQVMGTPRYMAPEQMEGSHAVDHRADIYSLGVVFYEMLTGHLPMGRFDPPSKQSAVDVRVDEVILRALAREPDRRYQHAAEIGGQVNAIRGIYSSEALQSIQQLGNVWPGASTMFDVAVGKVAGVVQGSKLSRFFAAPASPGIVAGLLCVAGILTTFIPWGYDNRTEFRVEPSIYGISHVPGIIVGVIHFVLAMIMLVSTTSNSRPFWRPWAILTCSVTAFALVLIFAHDSLSSVGTRVDFGLPLELTICALLLLVGAWDFRNWLHAPAAEPPARPGYPRSPQALVSPGGNSGIIGRDWVTLTHEQIDNELLPDVCMVCGKPGYERVNHTFIDFGLHKAYTDAGFMRAMQMRIACPVCRKHRGHWRVIYHVAAWALTLAATASLLLFLILADAIPRDPDLVLTWGIIGTIVFAGLAIAVISYKWITRVGVESITGDRVKLQRVAPAFVAAVMQQSSATGSDSAHP